MNKSEAVRLAKSRTLNELYEIIRESREATDNDENRLIAEVVHAEIRRRKGADHPVGLASLFAPRR